MNNSTELKLLNLLEGLSTKERLALREALVVIYLNDSSDYLNGLWGVVSAITDDIFDEEFDIKKLLNMLDPELGK